MGFTLNQKRAEELLVKNGWVRTLGGKHNVKMEKDGCRPITLPRHKGRDYSKNLTGSILRQAGITKKDAS